MVAKAADKTERIGQIFGGIAFCGVVFAAFAQFLFFRDNLKLQPWQVLFAFAGGVLFLVLGLLSHRWTESTGRRYRRAYYLVQTALVTALILVTPRAGFFAIIALPLGAQAMVDLPSARGVLLNLWLFAAAVASYWIPFGPASALRAGVSFGPAFLFTAIFAYLTARSFRLREQAEKLSGELSAANEQLRQQSEQASELATVHERNRLAREIHDGLGHYLTVIHVQIEAARTLLEREPARAQEALLKAGRLTREALDEVRVSVGGLHRASPPPPLPTRLHALCADSGFPVTYRVAGTPRPLSTAAEHALYRAAQEGLTNVRKHAAATQADLCLNFRVDGDVCLQVTNPGSAAGESDFRASDADQTGFGLRGMRERIELLGGRVIAGTQPTGGFSLLVEIPG